jgi:hypothetical protein
VTTGRGTFTRYLWLVSSILIIASVFIYFYIDGTERKEAYFNKLYFRQLVEISSHFEINLARLTNFRSVATNAIEAATAENSALSADAQSSKTHGVLKEMTERHSLGPIYRSDLSCEQSQTTAAAGTEPGASSNPPSPKEKDKDCTGLFVEPSSISTPYASSEVAVISYLDARGALETPLENLLPAELWGFSSLLVARGNGDVIIQRNKRANDFSHDFVNIENILAKAQSELSQIGKKEGDANKIESRILAHTVYVDEVLGGVKHRIYIYPSKMELQFPRPDTSDPEKNTEANSAKKEELLYFIGLKPLSEIRAEKLRITPRSSAVLLSAALIILLAFVFLKIQLAHPSAAFTRLEAFVAGLALVFFVLISIVSLISFSIAAQLQDETKKTAQATIHKLKNSFRDEIEDYIYRVDTLLKKNPHLTRTIADPNGSCSQCITALGPNKFFLSKNLPAGKDPKTSYSLENLFMLNRDGQISGVLLRGTEYTANPSKPPLSQRRYFRDALARDIWELKVNAREIAVEECDMLPGAQQGAVEQAGTTYFPVVIERLFNLTEGSRSTQFALPVSYQFEHKDAEYFDAKQRYNIPATESSNNLAPEVISFGVTIRAFQAPILPAGMQFAVIENATGTVLFHSNDDRSLLENFYQETDNNSVLLAQIRGSDGLSRPDAALDEPETFKGMYRGSLTRFWSARLHPDIPWTIVVFDNKSDRQSAVSIVFGISILVCTGIVLWICIFLIAPVALHKHPLRWLWPQADKVDLYPVLSLVMLGLAALYSLGLSFISNLLFFVLAVTIATFVTIFLFHKIFQTKTTAAPPPLQPARLFRRYTVFISVLLIFVVAVPTAIATRLVGKEVLLRMALYESLQHAESTLAAADASDQRLLRLCGNSENFEGALRDCASLYGGMPQTEAEKKNWNSAFRDSTQPTQTTEATPCDGDRIFCYGVENTTPEAAPSGSFDIILKPLERFWDLPLLLDVLDPESYSAAIVALPSANFFIHAQFPTLWLLFKQSPLLILAALLSTCLIGMAAISFLAIKLLGINVPGCYRMRRVRLDSASWPDFTAAETGAGGDYQKLRNALADAPSHRGILIGVEPAELTGLVKFLGDRLLRGQDNNPVIDALKLTADSTLRDALLKACTTGASNSVVLLHNLESVAFEAVRRNQLLETLEGLASIADGPSLVLLCDVAPFDILTEQSSYISDPQYTEYARAQESFRWTKLLSSFTQYYGWSATEREFVDKDARENAVLREVSAWPELYVLKDDLDKLKSELPGQEQITQYVLMHANPHYLRRWSLCTKEEELILYQLAKGQLVNPANLEPLEHLLQGGFVTRNPEWSIVNNSFARFVLTAEDEAIYTKWIKASEEGLWNVLRVPLFTSAIVIIGILMYSAQEQVESLLALATSVLAFLPLLLRGVSIVRGAPAPAEK